MLNNSRNKSLFLSILNFHEFILDKIIEFLVIDNI